MKYFILVFLLARFGSNVESLNLSPLDVGRSVLGTSKGVITKIPDVIPSPGSIFQGGKNLIAGYPFEQIFSVVNTFCKFLSLILWFYIYQRRYENLKAYLHRKSIGATALTTSNVQSRVTPDIAKMNYVMKVDNQNLLVPLNEPEKLWTLKEFNPDLPLVVMVTGWTSNVNNSENGALDVIYDAYRSRGNVNFVSVDTGAYVDTLYSWSAFNTEEIGSNIAKSLAILIKTYPIDNIHLIGKHRVIHICYNNVHWSNGLEL